MEPIELAPEISVSRQHLEEIRVALNQAYGREAALDIAESYRHNLKTTKRSRLASHLINACEIIEGYLDDELPEE